MSQKPRKRFQPTYRGTDLFAIQVPASGVSYSLELEVIQAAVWAQMSPAEFEQLPGEEQSSLVAAYQIVHRAEAVLAHESRRETRQGRARAPRTPRGRR